MNTISMSASEGERATGAKSQRIGGMDSIRFLCAAIVMLGHLGISNHRIYASSFTGIRAMVTVIFNCLFNGPAAVIVFFVISGFCIHFPNSNLRTLPVVSFYCRRFIRIVPPAIVFVLILRLGLKAKLSPQELVLWSVICESIYYLIYPILLYLRRRSSWPILTGIAFSVGFALVATHFDALQLAKNEYVAFGSWTWVVGLPCWLLGCWLAESYHSFPLLSPLKMWGVRIFIFGASVCLRVCMFHIASPLASNCILLNLFAIPIFFWLGAEIVYHASHEPVRVLEWAGGWSYSLYLMHPLAGLLLAVIGLSFIETEAATHFLVIIAALLASYGFYLLVERPSYLLAMTVDRALLPKGTRPGDSKREINTSEWVWRFRLRPAEAIQRLQLQLSARWLREPWQWRARKT
jgi:peptidoglycan/LPS O-acetylase OafA/YrhL